MGITGELVRSVFLKSKSVQRHDRTHAKINAMEKKRWRSSVRSYLCGDEHNSTFEAEDSGSFISSTIADLDLISFRSNMATNTSSCLENISSVYVEEDIASVKSSEATVNQPVYGDPVDEKRKEKHNSAYKLFQQDDAALIIQSAFRNFRARRESSMCEAEDGMNETKGSPSRESIGTSIEVQTGNSSDIFSIKDDNFDMCHQMRLRARAQVLKLQEEWDASTISSRIQKMRIQSKLEAATRRERALAYVFSQQLRICSKRKQSAINESETNIGWNWLERWMSARQMENTPCFDQIESNNYNNTLVRKRLMLDGSIEEKESCGSNEVSSLAELNIVSMPKNIPRPNKPRRHSASSHLCLRESKDAKKAAWK